MIVNIFPLYRLSIFTVDIVFVYSSNDYVVLSFNEYFFKNLMKSNLSIFFCWLYLRYYIQEIIAESYIVRFALCSFLKVLVLSITFSSLIHFQLFFVCY